MAEIKITINCEGRYCGGCRFARMQYYGHCGLFNDEPLEVYGMGFGRIKVCREAEIK